MQKLYIFILIIASIMALAFHFLVAKSGNHVQQLREHNHGTTHAINMARNKKSFNVSQGNFTLSQALQAYEWVTTNCWNSDDGYGIRKFVEDYQQTGHIEYWLDNDWYPLYNNLFSFTFDGIVDIYLMSVIFVDPKNNITQYGSFQLLNFSYSKIGCQLSSNTTQIVWFYQTICPS